MALNAGTVQASAELNKRGFMRGLSSMKEAGSKAAQRIGQKFRSVGTTLTGALTAPLVGVGALALKTAADYEKLQVQMNTLAGSAEEGAAAFKQLKEFSAGTPFQLKDLVKAQNTLVGMGQSMSDAFMNMQMLGDVASATGANIQELAITFGQASAEGKLMTRDIREFINRGVPLTKLLADSMGVAKNEIFDLASQGKISFDVLQQALSEATTGTGIYAKATEKAANTLSGVWSTFTDNFSMLLGQIGEDLVDAFNLKKLLKSVTSSLRAMTDWFSSLSDSTKRWAFIVTGLVAAIGPLSIALGGIISALPVLATGFAALTSPISLTIAAIAGLATAGAYVVDNWEAIKQRFMRLWVTIKNGVIEAIASIIDGINSFTRYIPGLEMAFAGVADGVRSMKSPLPEVTSEFKSFGESMGNTLDYVTGLFDTATNSAKGFNNGIKNVGGEGAGGAIQSFASDIGMADMQVSKLNVDIRDGLNKNLQNMRASVNPALEGMSLLEIGAMKVGGAIQKTMTLGELLGQKLGEAFSSALVFADDLGESIKNIAKQLASKSIINFLSLALGGGLGGLFGGGLFKGIGKLIGVNDALIQSNGNVVKFHPQDNLLAMKDFSKLSQPSGGGMSQKAMENAFAKALSMHTSKLGPKEAFLLTKEGEFLT